MVVGAASRRTMLHLLVQKGTQSNASWLQKGRWLARFEACGFGMRE